MIKKFDEFVRDILNESIWADIYDRSNGDTIRKEDDVDLLDIYDFCSYLNEKYNFFNRDLKPDLATVNDFKIKGVVKSSAINIPIFTTNRHVFYLIYDNEYDSLSMADISDFAPELYSNLKKEFDVRVIETDYGRNIRIYSDDKITNSFIVNVIEYIINNPLPKDARYKMCVKRAVNESIWADIYDRSTGDAIRKEDLIRTNDELKNKIKQLYEEQGEGDTLDVSSISNIIFCDDFSFIFYGPGDPDEGEYKNVKHIIGLETWDMSKVTNMKGMFVDCQSLTELDLSNWNVSNVTNMMAMFQSCESLTELNIDNWDVSNVTDMTAMFQSCESLIELNMDNWDVSKVTNMSYMFEGCQALTELSISNWDVSKVTNMNYMFEGCYSLTELNIDNWDVSNVTDMHSMFYGCESLTELSIDNWNVSNVTDMSTAFSDCLSLAKLNIDNWDVSNVTDMAAMFFDCKSLAELNIDNWDVSNVTDMRSMFNNCNKIKKPKWY